MGESDVPQDGSRAIRSYSKCALLNRDRLQLSAWRCNQFIVWIWCLATEDVEHESYALEAEHVISVGGDLNLELRGFLFAIDDGTFAVRGVFVELNTEFETELLEFFGGIPIYM